MKKLNTHFAVKRLVIFISVLSFMSNTLTAQVAGALDLTFNGTGTVVYDKDNVDVYQDVKVLSDGKIIATGTIMTPTYASKIEVTKYLADGNFDTSFGTNGHFNFQPSTETGSYACLIKDDGKILIGGYTTNYTTWWMVLIQLNPDGTKDASFGNNGVVQLDLGPGEDIIYSLAVDTNGMILAAGYAQNASFQNVPVVLRFTETGVLDTSFGTDGVASVAVTETDNDFSAVSLQSDGKIVAAGHISNGLSWFSLLIARFDENGILDPSYGTDGVVNLNLGNVDDEFFDMRLTPDDEAILTGFSVTQSDIYYHMLLMKFNNAGQPDSTFGTNGAVISGEVPYSTGNAMVLQTDGRILITGSTGELAPANNDWAVWRYMADGTPDPDFGTNGLVTTEFFGNADEALGIDLFQDKIVVAGKTRNADNHLDFAVARYNNDVGVFVAESPAPANEVTVSPNPVYHNQSVNVDLNLSRAGNITIEILNTTGNLVSKKMIEAGQAGKHTIALDLPYNAPSGVYYVRISGSQSSVTTKKIIVM